MRPSDNPCRAGDQFKGAQPGSMIVNVGHDHELVGTCFRNQRIDARTNRIGRANARPISGSELFK
jgi:hypothetical protein